MTGREAFNYILNNYNIDDDIAEIIEEDLRVLDILKKHLSYTEIKPEKDNYNLNGIIEFDYEPIWDLFEDSVDADGEYIKAWLERMNNE